MVVRFVFCCVICLGLLYAVILRHDGYLVDPAQMTRQMTLQVARGTWAVPRQAGAGIAAVAGPQVAARVEAYCRHDPEACLAAATTLAAPTQRRAGRVTLGVAAP